MKRFLLILLALMLCAAPVLAEGGQMFVMANLNMSVLLVDDLYDLLIGGEAQITMEPLGANGGSLVFYSIEEPSLLEEESFEDEQEYNEFIREIGVPIFGLTRQEANGVEIPLGLEGYEEILLLDAKSIYRSYRIPEEALDLLGERSRSVADVIVNNFSDASSIRIVDDLEGDSALGEFSAMDLDGNRRTSELFKDYPLTLVNVWATFCGPCLSEMPDLAELSAEYADRGVQIIGIVTDVNEGDSDNAMFALAKQIADETGASCYTNLVPDDVIIMKRLVNTTAVPESFFVDSNGVQVGEDYIGARSKEEWASIIDEMLARVGEE